MGTFGSKEMPPGRPLAVDEAGDAGAKLFLCRLAQVLCSPGFGGLTLKLKLAQKPCIVWSLGPKALEIRVLSA